MLAFSSLEDTTPAALSWSNVLKVKDSSSLVALWFLVGLVYHLFVVLILRGNLGRVLATIRMASSHLGHATVCPKRRARWYKCARRCAAKHRDCMTMDCPISCATKTLAKLHLPPPLPWKKKNKGCRPKCRCTQAEAISSDTATPSSDAIATQSEGATEKLTSATTPKSQTLMPTSGRRPSVTPLIDLARMQHWKLILEQGWGVSRREAKHRDSDGLYPLHWAVSGGPPVEVVEVLLHAYPSAARKTDREGSTPLHFAAHYSASVRVMEALLKTNPRAIRVQDRYGRSPLYHAVDKRAGLDVLRTLAWADPSMITVPCLPLDDPRRTRNSSEVTRSVATRTPLFLAWATVVTDRKARETKRGRLWDKAQLLLEAAYLHQYKNRTPSIPRTYRFLQATIAMDIYLPDQIVSMAMQVHPEQLRLPEEVTGQLPLSQAAAFRQYCLERSRVVIDVLLKAYPEAARVRDALGRSALSLAVEAGKPWAGLVEHLFRANPEALEWRDGTTGLRPALVAAAASTGASSTSATDSDPATSDDLDNDPYKLLSDKHHEWIQRRRLSVLVPKEEETDRVDPETRELDSVFQLVRAGPSVLAS